MNLLKSRLEIEVSEYKFPVLISEVEDKNGQYSIEEYDPKTTYDENSEYSKVDYIISKIEELDASETRDVLSWLYSNKQCEFDEVLRDEDSYGLHINGDGSRRDMADEVYNFIENDAEICHRVFEKMIKGEDFEDLVGGAVDSYNKLKAFRLALEILKHIDENLNI